VFIYSVGYTAVVCPRTIFLTACTTVVYIASA
jgi:hypothetical protein